jgi:hypothetical protein
MSSMQTIQILYFINVTNLENILSLKQRIGRDIMKFPKRRIATEIAPINIYIFIFNSVATSCLWPYAPPITNNIAPAYNVLIYK